MSTTSKLWLGFGLLLLLLVAIGLFVSHRLRVIDRALTTITAVREPATAATYEMEVTLLSASTAVVDYVNTGDKGHRRLAVEGFAAFDGLLLQYDRIAQSTPSRELGRRITSAYQLFRAKGDTLMELSEQQRGLFRAFDASTAALRGPLEERLQSAADAKGKDTDKKAAEAARLAAAVSEIGALIGSLVGSLEPPPASRLDELHTQFREALDRYRRLRLNPEEENAANTVEKGFEDYVAHARELRAFVDTMRRSMANFLDQRSELESLLDEGIQVLARIDLLLAQQSARRAIETSLLAVLVLLAAGITIGSATALPAGRSIVRTERRLREQTAELAVAHRRKDEFLGVLAHELRNPLAPLSNALYVLEGRGDELPAPVRDAHAMMQRQVQQITRLVDDLLDVSRINEGKITLRHEPVDVSALTAELAASLRRRFDEQGHTLRVAASEPVWVDADPVRLGQVVTNLLNNAAKYTPPGGTIDVSVAHRDDSAVFTVRDTGVGIPLDMLERVFEPFVQVDSSRTRQHGGLGIGLTLVKRLVELHGGSVRAESAGPGTGSTFVVALPARPAPVEAAMPALKSASPAPHTRPHRILVVDDSEAGARTMAELLRLWGHEVDVALDGPAALHAVSDRTPELVLLDIALPGMDGYEVAERLRRMPGGDRLRLIALTGFGQDGDRRRALAAGFDEHLTKPVKPSTLLELLART